MLAPCLIGDAGLKYKKDCHMTRNELIDIGNVIERATIAIDRSPMLALEHAREAHRKLGEILGSKPLEWDEAKNIEYAKKLRAGEPTTEEEWDASFKWHRDQLSKKHDAGVRVIIVKDIDPHLVAEAAIRAQAGIGKERP